VLNVGAQQILYVIVLWQPLADDVFTISSIQYTYPPTYKIADFGGEEIHGTFYEQELQKTSQEIYTIEKVISKRGNRSLVKWLGYPESFNSWVDNKNMMKLNKQHWTQWLTHSSKHVYKKDETSVNKFLTEELRRVTK